VKMVDGLAQMTVGHCFLAIGRKQAVRVLRALPGSSANTGVVSYEVEDVTHGYKFKCSESLLGRELTDMEVVAWAARR
jgi:hypothetical protein